MINKIHHIGIAVRSIEETANLYTRLLGLRIEEISAVPDQKVKTAILPVGETVIELAEPTDPQGPIAKYIQKRGEGIHHIALEVNDIESTLETLKGKGIHLIDEHPRIGASGHKIAFVHPRETKVLIELVESCE